MGKVKLVARAFHSASACCRHCDMAKCVQYLPMIGSLLSTVALWMKTSKKIRLISFFSGPCWLIYNVVNGAYSAAVNELIAMTSIVIGILRHDIKKKQCG